MVKLKKKAAYYIKRAFGNFKERKWCIVGYIFLVLLFTLNNIEIPLQGNPLTKEQITIVFFVIFIGIFCFLAYSPRIYNFIFIVIILFGTVTAFVTPILDSPDESVHLRRSELTSRGNLLPEIDNEKGYSVITSVVDLTDETKKTVLQTKIDAQPINYNFEAVQHVANANPFFGYIPQALGINLAKTLNLNAIWLIWFGRISNVIMAAFVCRQAVKIAPAFKMHLALVACFPMTIYQFASLSIDATINSFALLVIAYFLNFYYKDNKTIGIKECFTFLLICLIVTFSKITYVFLILLFLLIPKCKFISKSVNRFKYFIIFIAFLISVCWYIFTSMLPNIPNDHTAYLLANHIDMLEQIKFILHNPLNVTILFIKNIIQEGPAMLSSMFTFGALSYNLGSAFIIYGIFYGAIAVMYPNQVGKINLKSKIGITFICIFVYISTILVFYLTWSTVGQFNISGVQGRYFIPLLGLLPLVLNVNYQKENFPDTLKLDKITILMFLFFISLMIIDTAFLYY